MADPKIRIRRSSTPNKVPNITQLELGELAINTYDGKIYLEQDQGAAGVGNTVVRINPWNVGLGTTAYNITFESGKVGIGTTVARHALDVGGNAVISGILTVGGSSVTVNGANNTVQVGSALSLGHSIGLQYHTQNLHAEGFLVNQIAASGIITAAGGIDGIGIHSAGTEIQVGVITSLNFIGTGNTFGVRGGTVDISIAGSGGGGSGAQGATGATGAQGAAGSAGATGAQGASGGGGGGGASVTVSSNPPGSPSSGDLWWDSDVGEMYVYYADGDSNQWVETSGGSETVVVSDNAPSSPNHGDLWWESDTGQLKIYYNDGDSAQWVDANAGVLSSLTVWQTNSTGINTTSNVGFGTTTASAAITVGAGGTITVGTGVTFESTGQGSFTGIVTASSFRGDGSQLTGISVGGSSGIDFNDNVKIRMGTGNDFEIYHDNSSRSGFRFTNPEFRIMAAHATTGRIQFGVSNSSTDLSYGSLIAEFKKGAECYLTYNSSQKIATSNTGISVYGTVVARAADIDDFISVGNNIHLGNAGVVTATSFVGDGSGLTGISGGAAGLSTDAQENTIGGANAGANLDVSGQSGNTLIGFKAGNDINSGDFNTGIGHQALLETTTGSNNTAIGRDSGRNNFGGSGTVFAGYAAGYDNQNGSYNIGIGWRASQGIFASPANHKIGIGYQAIRYAKGDYNIGIGYRAGYDSSAFNEGTHNITIGYSSGKLLSTGSDNTIMGADAGDALSSGSNNLILGHDAAASSATVSNEITLGDTNITKFRVPGINVVLKDNGGTPTQGHVLTVDANGEAGFAAASGGGSSIGGSTGVDFNDNVKVRFGTGNDLQLFHNGSGAYLYETQGNDITIITNGNIINQTNDTFTVKNAIGHNRITASGSVLLFHDGTEKFRTNSTGAQIGGNLRLGTSGSGNIYHSGDDDTNIGFPANDTVSIETAGSERLRITSDGKLLVGRTSSITITGDGSSHVFEAITDNGYALATHSNTSNKRGIGIYYPTGGTAGDAIRFAIGSSAKFIVLGSGNVTNANNSYGSISDISLKENIVDANSQWDDIKNIKIRNYNFKESTGQQTHTQIGVVAQELETVSPKLVETSDKDGLKTVQYSVLYMKAVKALQEAMAKIEILEAKVAALEGS